MLVCGGGGVRFMAEQTDLCPRAATLEVKPLRSEGFGLNSSQVLPAVCPALWFIHLRDWKMVSATCGVFLEFFALKGSLMPAF